MVDDHRVEEVRVRLAALDRVEDGPILRVQVQQHADVSELEVGVDQADPTTRLALKREREVGGDRGAARRRPSG